MTIMTIMAHRDRNDNKDKNMAESMILAETEASLKIKSKLRLASKQNGSLNTNIVQLKQTLDTA